MPYTTKPNKQYRHGVAHWVVSLGKRHTGAKRQRHYFKFRKEAKQFIATSEAALRKQGTEAFELPLPLRAEALKCSEDLKPFNSSLSEAVAFYISHQPKPGFSKTFAQLTAEFLQSRKSMNCRPTTMVQYKSYLKVISAELGKDDITTIRRADIEDWLEESEWSPRTRKNYLVTLTTFLGFLVARGYRKDNPAETIDRPILDDRPVGILTVEQVKKLLQAALTDDRDMIPLLAIALFAGLRRSELFSLDWSEINLESRLIEVKGIKAKTRQRRLVHIHDSLRAWLGENTRKKGKLVNLQSIDSLSDRLRTLALSAAIDPWPHNAMRHSFGSYFLARTKDENLTATEMGNSPGVIMRHYRALVRDADVVNYWNITPNSIHAEQNG